MTRKQELEQIIINAREKYYSNIPIMTDDEYDKLERELAQIDPHNYLLKQIGSSVKSSFEEVRHEKKMYSLEKVYDYTHVLSWASKHSQKYICMPKIDGFAISLKYEKGKLIRAATRGDGLIGEDVTENVKQISNIPLLVPTFEDFEVRGEICITKENFETLINKGIIPQDSNIRNIVPGSVRSHDSNVTKDRNLSFYAYDSNISTDIISSLASLEKYGFNIVPFITPNLEKDKLEQLPYKCDGLVYRIIDAESFEKQGYTSHHPKGALAFKYENESEMTTLKAIEWRVSRTGLINPIAIVEPVMIGGVEIERTTLHNLTQIKNKALTLNSKVMISRRGDVIPHLEYVVEKGNKEIEIPTHCPYCKQLTCIQRDDASGIENVICMNDMCEGKLIDKIIYFITVFDMKGVGNKLIEKLVTSEFIKLRSLHELFELTQEKLITIDGIKDKSANKIISAIQKARFKPFSILIECLGIDGVGKSLSKTLSNHFISFEDIIENNSRLKEIPGVGSTIYRNLLSGIIANKTLIENLLKYVVIISNDNIQGEKLKDKSFCITGTLWESRESIEAMIMKEGGEIKSVSKKLDYLIVGEDPGTTKLTKATEFGIKTITETELKNMLGIDAAICKENGEKSFEIF